MLYRTIFIAMCMRNPLATDVLLGTIFSATGAPNRVWEDRKKMTTGMLHETTWTKFGIWRCKFLKLVQKRTTQKLRRSSAYPCYTALHCNFCAKNRRSESFRVTSSLCIDWVAEKKFVIFKLLFPFLHRIKIEFFRHKSLLMYAFILRSLGIRASCSSC